MKKKSFVEFPIHISYKESPNDKQNEAAETSR